jgi:hypothetical protein
LILGKLQIPNDLPLLPAANLVPLEVKAKEVAASHQLVLVVSHILLHIDMTVVIDPHLLIEVKVEVDGPGHLLQQFLKILNNPTCTSLSLFSEALVLCSKFTVTTSTLYSFYKNS